MGCCAPQLPPYIGIDSLLDSCGVKECDPCQVKAPLDYFLHSKIQSGELRDVAVDLFGQMGDQQVDVWRPDQYNPHYHIWPSYDADDLELFRCNLGRWYLIPLTFVRIKPGQDHAGFLIVDRKNHTYERF